MFNFNLVLTDSRKSYKDAVNRKSYKDALNKKSYKDALA